jgi:hypothetical protein
MLIGDGQSVKRLTIVSIASPERSSRKLAFQ